MEAPAVKLELDEEGEQIYGKEPHDVDSKASIDAEIGEDWADRGPLAARLRRRALYHLRVGPTTVLPLLLVLHDPRQIEAFKTPSAEDEDEVADDVECKRSSGEGSAQFLRALTMALRDVLMAYLVSSTNSRVWLSVPSVSSTSSSSGGRRFFSVPGRSDVRFTYRFAPTTPRYAVMTKSSPSSGHKRRSLSSTSTSSTHHEDEDEDREHRAKKKPRQDDADDEEEKAKEKMDEFEERNEAEEEDGESSVGAVSGSEEQDGLASDGEEEEEDDEEEEEQDVDEEDDEEGLSEDELLERRRKKQMKQLADSYRGYSVTPHTLVVETLCAAQAATMDHVLEHAAATKSPPPAHKLSHYFGGGNGNGGSSGAAAKTTTRGGGKRRAPAGRKSAGAATSKAKTKTNSRPKKRLSN
jgi:hypothetical protein